PSLPHAVDASALAGRHRLPSLTSLDLNTENTIFGFLHFSIIFQSVFSRLNWLKMHVCSWHPAGGLFFNKLAMRYA
ncbi:MAG: hypothetical protein ACRESI_02615, partial [Gammaproteobacteria bacterium]